jgi:hypothetical protein
VLGTSWMSSVSVRVGDGGRVGTTQDGLGGRLMVDSDAVRRRFLLADGNQEPRPWSEVLPWPEFEKELSSGTKRKQMEDDNARFMAANSLRRRVAQDYCGVFRRYEEYCRAHHPPRVVDSDESCAAWLTSLIARKNKPVQASTLLGYAKTLQAYCMRLRNPRCYLRPMQKGSASHDVVLGAGKAQGRTPTDEWESVTWEQIEAVDAAAVASLWEAGAVYARITWEIAAHASDTLECRVCDVTETTQYSDDGHPLVMLCLPTFKMDYGPGASRGGLLHPISCPVTSRRLIALRDRRLSESSGQRGSRLWPMTRDQLMTRFRQLETPIRTARAWRRGFITAALAAGYLRTEVASVSHHDGTEVMGRYSAHLPAAERDMMIMVAHGAKQGRRD